MVKGHERFIFLNSHQYMFLNLLPSDKLVAPYKMTIDHATNSNSAALVYPDQS